MYGAFFVFKEVINTMKTHLFKRGIAGLLSLVMCLSAFIGLGTTTAFAAGEQAEVYLISFPRSGDANLDYSGTWGHSNLHYMNGWFSGESKYTTIRAMHSYDGNICYCIEPGTPQDTGDRYTSKDETFWDNLPSDFNNTTLFVSYKDEDTPLVDAEFRVYLVASVNEFGELTVADTFEQFNIDL